MSEQVEAAEGEVVESTLQPSDSERRVRVYAASGGKDDFIITLPAKCSMTFGYFNPGGTQDSGKWGGKSPGEKCSALRVYGPSDGLKKDQLACFLGVRGFRDESIKMAKVIRKVTVETRVVDDGGGNIEDNRKQLVELSMQQEDDGDFPF